MGTRRKAREWAVQILFRCDVNPPDDLEAVFAEFWERNRASPVASAFTERLVRGAWERRGESDAMLRSHAEHWDLERMGIVERSVMRMCLFEMLHCPDIPPVVSINEAVDLAKYYSTSEAGRFVNGLLDRVRSRLPPAAAAGEDGAGAEGKREPRRRGTARGGGA
jgi:N utilization substance protein B